MPVERDPQAGARSHPEFPDKRAVRDFFDSAEHAPLRTFRQSSATASALVIED
jgi:uncharacterized protein (DUF1330 family)